MAWLARGACVSAHSQQNMCLAVLVVSPTGACSQRETLRQPLAASRLSTGCPPAAHRLPTGAHRGPLGTMVGWGLAGCRQSRPYSLEASAAIQTDTERPSHSASGRREGEGGREGGCSPCPDGSCAHSCVQQHTLPHTSRQLPQL